MTGAPTSPPGSIVAVTFSRWVSSFQILRGAATRWLGPAKPEF
jgi:hypothetical protein